MIEAFEKILFSLSLLIWNGLGWDRIGDDPLWRVGKQWTITEQEHFPRHIFSMEASSAEIVRLCRENPEKFVLLPFGVGGAQEVLLDGASYATFGDPSFQRARGTMLTSYVSCEVVKDAMTLTWRSYTGDALLAHLMAFPKLIDSQPIAAEFLNTTLQTLSAGALLFLAILILALFSGKGHPAFFYSVTMSVVSFGIYFLVHSRTLESLIPSFKWTWDLSLFACYAGECFMTISFVCQKLVSKWVAAGFCPFAIILGCHGFLLSDLGSGGILLRFSYPLIATVLMMAIVGLLNRPEKHGARFYLMLVALLAAVISAFFEIAIFSFNLQAASVLPLTVLGLLITQTLEINADVVATYQQNSKLNEDLRTKESNLATMVRTTQMLAHDIRRPFSMAKAFLAMLSRTQNFEDFSRFRDRFGPEIDKSLVQVNTMLEDILKMGPSQDWQREDISPIDVIKNALQNIFTASHQVVALEFCLEHKSCAIADKVKIERVIANLLSNALNAMKGKGKIAIRTMESERFIHFHIANTGSYIPPENIEKIFEPFFTSNVKLGTGLGLTICKRFVEAFGGSIACKSDFDWTEFSFTVPKSPKAESAEYIKSLSSKDFSIGTSFSAPLTEIEFPELAAPLQKFSDLLGRKFKLAVIEDEPLYADLLRSFVAPLSKHIESCFHVDGASLEKKAISELDLVICDVDLGRGQDGFKIIEAIRAINPRVKICMHSNRGLFEYQNIAKELGADLFLPKPMTEYHFSNLMQKSLEISAGPLG